MMQVNVVGALMKIKKIIGEEMFCRGYNSLRPRSVDNWDEGVMNYSPYSILYIPLII